MIVVVVLFVQKIQPALFLISPIQAFHKALFHSQRRALHFHPLQYWLFHLVAAGNPCPSYNSRDRHKKNDQYIVLKKSSPVATDAKDWMNKP